MFKVLLNPTVLLSLCLAGIVGALIWMIYDFIQVANRPYTPMPSPPTHVLTTPEGCEVRHFYDRGSNHYIMVCPPGVNATIKGKL